MALAYFIKSIENQLHTLSGSGGESEALTKGQNYLNCIPFHTFWGSNETAWARNFTYVYAKAGPAIQYQKGNIFGTTKSAVSVVEFDPLYVKVQQTSFQTGNADSNSGVVGSTAITEVDLSKTFILPSYQGSQYGEIWQDNNCQVFFDSSTKIRAVRTTNVGDMTHRNVVVEALYWWIWDVAHLDFTLTGTEVLVDVPQDAPWTRQSNNTLIITSYRSTNNNNNPDEGCITADWSSGQIRIRRGSSNNEIYGKLQLVTSPYFNIQRGQVDFGTGDTDQTATIDTIDTAVSFIWGTAPQGSRTLGSTTEDQGMSYVLVQDSTTVAGQKGASGLATDGAFQVIETQGDSPGWGTTTTTTTTTTSTFPYLDYVVPNEDIPTPYEYVQYWGDGEYWDDGTNASYSVEEWDWESYTLDQQPSDWTRRDTYADGPEPDPPFFHVKSKATPLDPPYDDRVLKIRSGNAWIMACSPNDVGTIGDSEQLMLFTQNTTNNNGGAQLKARIQGSPQYRTFYDLMLYDANKLKLMRWVSGSPATLDEVAKPYTVDTWYWMRLQIIGTNPVAIKGKVWAYGTEEPGTWDIEYNDSNASRIQTDGYVGPSDYSNAGFGPSPYTDTDVAYYKVLEDAEDFYYVSGPGGYIEEAGTWATGYRAATKIRLEGFHDQGTPWEVQLRDNNNGVIATATFPVSGSWQTVEADITWGAAGSGGDINDIYMGAPSIGRIRNIEFLEPASSWVKEGVETSIHYLGLDNTVFYNFPNDEDGIYGINGEVEWLGFEEPHFNGRATGIRLAVRGKNSYDLGVSAEIWNGSTKLGDADIASFGHFYDGRRSDWIAIDRYSSQLSDLKVKLTAVGSEVHTWISELQLELAGDELGFTFTTTTTTTTTTTIPGWLGSWAKREELEIDGTNLTTEETGIPVCIPISTAAGLSSFDASEIFDDLGSSSLKIAVTTSDGQTQCKVEVAHWDSSAETATLFALVPTLPAEGTTLYLYYDPAEPDNTTNVGATGSTPAQAVWDSNFVFVWHMQDNDDGAVNGIKDSTSNNNHATAVSMDDTSTQTGPLGKCQNLLGVNDYLRGGDWGDPYSQLTAEIFIKPTQVSPDDYMALLHKAFVGLSPGTTPYMFEWVAWSTSGPPIHGTIYWGNSGSVSTDIDYGRPDVDEWSYLSINFPGSGQLPVGRTVRYDGQLSESPCNNNVQSGDLLNKTGEWQFGTYYQQDNDRWFGGFIQDARVSKVGRSTTWNYVTGLSLNDQLITWNPVGTTTTTTTTTTTSVPETTTTTSTTTTTTTLPDWNPDLTFDYEVDVLVSVPSDSLLEQRVGFSVEGEERPLGWKWDEMIWSKDQHRHDVVLPTLYDPDISTIPSDSWQSGIGHNLDLKINEVIEDPGLGHPWRPLIRPGHYFIGPENFYLFSPNYVTRFGSDETTGGLSKIDLNYMPKQGVPLLVAFMKRDDDGAVRDVDHFRKRVRFTGKTVITQDASGNLVSRQEAVHLDSDGNVVNYNIKNLPVAPEQRNLEYTLVTRPEMYVKEYLPIDVGKGEAKLISFDLDYTPVDGPPLDFTNDDIFQTYVADQVPVSEGEYSVGYLGSTTIPEGQVQVVTSDRDQLPEYVTYWRDYPATVMFNDYYVRRIGFSEWGDAPPGYIDTEPGIEFVETADFLGESSAQPNQVFYLSYFPIVDFTTLQVFVYDPRNEIVTEWTRVDDIEAAGPDDEVFTISPDGGFILFGNGIAGKIPHIHAYIAACYDYVPYVQYMPEEEWRLIEPTEVNLQPLFNSTHRGFVYLSHKELSVDNLVLQTNRSRVPDRAETYGPISAGNDYALLTCTAFDKDGGSVPDVDISWKLDPSMGYINGASPLYTRVQTTTDSSGKTRVVYTPVRTAGDMGTTVYLFDGLGNPLDNIKTTVIANDTLELSEFVEANVEDIFVFMVIDDDPLQPYDPYTRTGGRRVILYRYDEDEGDYVLVKPTSVVNKDNLVFDYALPTPSTYPNLVQYDVITDRIIEAKATTINPVTGLLIESNPIKFYLDIPESQKGVYTLPTTTDKTGSTLDSAVYLTIDRFGTIKFIFEAEDSIDPGQALTTTTTSTTTTTTTTVEGLWAVDPLWSEAGSQEYQNRQYRQIISSPLLSGSANKIRIQFVAHETQDTVITGSSIGLRLSVDDYDGPPTRVTFDGGNSGTTILAGQTKWSDWIDFTISDANEYLVHYASTGNPSFFYIYRWVGGAGEDPGPTYYKTSAGDDTMTESVAYVVDNSVESHIQAIQGTTI